MKSSTSHRLRSQELPWPTDAAGWHWRGSFSEALSGLRFDPQYPAESPCQGLPEALATIAFGKASEIRMLLSKLDLNMRVSDGSTALHVAVRASRPDIVQTLLGRGADVGAVDEQGETPLHDASNGEADCAEILVRAGAVIDERNEQGDSPLMKAVRSRHLQCAMRLLKLGANPWLVSPEGATVREMAIEDVDLKSHLLPLMNNL